MYIQILNKLPLSYEKEKNAMQFIVCVGKETAGLSVEEQDACWLYYNMATSPGICGASTASEDRWCLMRMQNAFRNLAGSGRVSHVLDLYRHTEHVLKVKAITMQILCVNSY